MIHGISIISSSPKSSKQFSQNTKKAGNIVNQRTETMVGGMLQSIENQEWRFDCLGLRSPWDDGGEGERGYSVFCMALVV